MSAAQRAALRKAQLASARKRRRRRRRSSTTLAVVAGSAAVAGVVIASRQRHPARLTRTEATQRRIVARHVTRARKDHRHLTSLRAKVFPTSVLTAKQFNQDAARREARRILAGYRYKPPPRRR